jgi:hypothetical protein
LRFLSLDPLENVEVPGGLAVWYAGVVPTELMTYIRAMIYSASTAALRLGL